MGKGGGSAPAPAPSQQTVTQTAIPEYARPYVENMLGKTEALTDINQNPYQAYGGQRIQEFTPLQQQAFGGVANMQVAPQIGMGTGLAAASGLGAMGAGQDYYRMATDPRAMSAFMSPYMQNVVDLQKQEAFRDYQKGLGALGARAAASGAFGGTRAALERAEAGRNLNTQLANIQAQGTQNAFNQAQQAQQFGANLGLQGFGQGLQAASTLGQLGQTGFGQQMGILGEQQKVGAVQQAQGQQALDLAYQDFLKQRNYPYQQLAFMSDMLRGLPLSQSAQQVYTAPPNVASQLGGLGMAGLGIYGMSGGFKKEGGVIKGYKEGGKIGYVSGGDIKMMSTEQLQELLNNPSLTPMEVEMIEKALMVRRRMEMNPEAGQMMARSGIGAISTGDMVPEFTAAGGGIVAFSKGDEVKLPEDYAERRKRLAEKEEELMKGLENYDFSKSEGAMKQYESDIARGTAQAPWRTLTAIGLGTAEAASQPGGQNRGILGNLAVGGKYGLSEYGRALGEIAADKKELIRQGVELEKSRYGRDVQRLGSLQSAINQLDNRQIQLMNAKNQIRQSQMFADQKLSDQVTRHYGDKVAAEKAALLKRHKLDDISDAEIELMAKQNVFDRLTGRQKEVLFGDANIASPYKTFPTPSSKAISALKSRKDLDVAKRQFNEIFGPGAAEKALGTK